MAHPWVELWLIRVIGSHHGSPLAQRPPEGRFVRCNVARALDGSSVLRWDRGSQSFCLGHSIHCGPSPTGGSRQSLPASSLASGESAPAPACAGDRRPYWLHGLLALPAWRERCTPSWPTSWCSTWLPDWPSDCRSMAGVTRSPNTTVSAAPTRCCRSCIPSTGLCGVGLQPSGRTLADPGPWRVLEPPDQAS